MLVQIIKRKEHGRITVEAITRFQCARVFSEQEYKQEIASINKEDQVAMYLSEMIKGSIKDQVRESMHKMMFLVPPAKQGECIKHSEEIHKALDDFFKPEIIEVKAEEDSNVTMHEQNMLIRKQNKMIEDLKKERDYWKLSFDKQVEASRGGQNGSK